ncbi:MAG: LysR family transcriptional regulator [Firmicutes bacterium]|nr:LysR family transcriptional regulator [Bacillota bacterium]
MDLDSLKAFCTVVEAGSISKAAKKLYVSQPSLSVKIQDLENLCQSKLLERTNRGVTLTDAGQVVYQHAQKILFLGEKITKELDRSRNQVVILQLGASSTVGNYALPCTIFNFKEKYPEYHINLKTFNTETVIEKIINHEIDIGLVEGPLTEKNHRILNQEGIETKSVTTSELILVAHNSEKWPQDEISLDAFKELPLIIREKGSGIRTTMEMVLSDLGMALDDLNIVLELESTNGIISAVTSDKGVTLLPKMAVRKELHYKILKQIQVKEVTFQHEITTLYYPDDLAKPLHRNFLELLHSPDRGFC